MEKFWDFFTLRPIDLISILIYVLMDNFCPVFFMPNFKFYAKESFNELERKKNLSDLRKIQRTGK